MKLRYEWKWKGFLRRDRCAEVQVGKKGKKSGFGGKRGWTVKMSSLIFEKF